MLYEVITAVCGDYRIRVQVGGRSSGRSFDVLQQAGVVDQLELIDMCHPGIELRPS